MTAPVSAGLSPSALAGAAAPPRDDKEVAAKQLEAFFVRRLLAEARPKGGLLDGGFAGETFAQMLDEALADQIAGAGDLGMADMFAAELGKGAGAAPGAATVSTGAAAGPGAPLGSAGLPSAGRIPATTLPLPTRAPGAVDALGPEVPGLPRLALPVAGRTSSGFGPRTHPVKGTTSVHHGLDIAAPTGTPVKAAAAGTVIHAGPAGTYGNLVLVQHPNGVETRYAHLSAVTVTKGAAVEVGQEVGKVGSTGMSTGPHLHFEVRQGGKSLDPQILLPLNSSANRTSR